MRLPVFVIVTSILVLIDANFPRKDNGRIFGAAVRLIQFLVTCEILREQR
jgi:hypothetical protein